jgi:hypothetical protein
MALGLSLPEACSRTWRDVTIEERRLIGYRNRFITLGAQAVSAFEELDEYTPPRLASTRLLWKPGTARRWLKAVTHPQSPTGQLHQGAATAVTAPTINPLKVTA